MVAAAQRRATVPATRALASTRRSVQPAMLRPEGDRGGLARAGSSKASQGAGSKTFRLPAPQAGRLSSHRACLGVRAGVREGPLLPRGAL